MKIFSFQTGLTKYTYPAVKLLLCILALALVFAVRVLIDYPVVWINVLSAVICVSIAIAGILCFYISIIELRDVHSNRRNATVSNIATRTFTTEEIVAKATNDDAIEFEVWMGSRIIKLGSHSNFIMSKNILTDKRYFIETAEYETTEEFAKNLSKVFPDNAVCVARIDGIPIKKISDLSKY